MGLFKKKKQKPEMQEAALTIYACRKNTCDIYPLAASIFSETLLNQAAMPDGGYELTLQDNTKIQFHITCDPSEMAVQTNGMATFFARSPLGNEAVKENALRQISLFTVIIGITFTINNDSNRTNYIINSIYYLADKLCGFILHPNMYLYQPDGKLLISIDGKTDLEQFSPIADSSILENGLPEEQADIERKEHSIQKCKELGLKYAEHLKAAVYEAACEIPSTEEIIHRLSCIFAAAVCSEACNDKDNAKASELVTNMLGSLEQQYQISNWLSAEEREYTKHPLDFPQLHPKFGWRYECCAVLLWALGMWELGEPRELCDAGEIGKILWKNDFNSLKEKAVPKSKKEILDKQDLIFRYNWACVDAYIHQQQLKTINGEIVHEWHYALNWLTSAYGIKNWDDVQVHT